MPTTNVLMTSSSFFTPEIKKRLRDKVSSDFDIKLYSKVRECKDDINARKQICTAVSQIRVCMRGNEMLLRHNIEYGFFRNLLGGCVFAIGTSIIGLIINHNTNSNYSLWFLISVGCYSIPVLFSKQILNNYGNNYAKILFEQYLSYQKK